MAILIVAVVWLCVVLYSLALALGYASEPSLPFCRFAIFVFSFTVQGRILGLTLLSAMVLQPVACGTAESGAKWLMYSLAPCWAIAFILTFRILMPETYAVQYVECIACYPSRVDGAAYQVIGLTKTFLSLVIGCAIPLLMCICIPLGTLCYIKRHTISEGDKYSFFAKFAAFLIPGSICSLGSGCSHNSCNSINRHCWGVCLMHHCLLILLSNSNTGYCVSETSSETATLPILQQVPETQWSHPNAASRTT